jgi:hypothetical protein
MALVFCCFWFNYTVTCLRMTRLAEKYFYIMFPVFSTFILVLRLRCSGLSRRVVLSVDPSVLQEHVSIFYLEGVVIKMVGSGEIISANGRN